MALLGGGEMFSLRFNNNKLIRALVTFLPVALIITTTLLTPCNGIIGG